ncbi:hypothetical protein B4U80_05360 [Leptotrombidium deliense]|uniref:Uncharacterized protein n=1 Tax=Leptotrombidium deliense TaxID=299467 RepID=A0A443RYR1_9ACAR|nr:hypothetical protein B4U80_05360 [Leptotrombidium deliense]
MKLTNKHGIHSIRDQYRNGSTTQKLPLSYIGVYFLYLLFKAHSFGTIGKERIIKSTSSSWKATSNHFTWSLIYCLASKHHQRYTLWPSNTPGIGIQKISDRRET